MLSIFLDFLYFVLIKLSIMRFRLVIVSIALLISFQSELWSNDFMKDSIKYSLTNSTIPDTLIIDIDNSGFLSNLDSLLNLWYVKKSLGSEWFRDSVYAVKDSVYFNYPDSVYIERLNRIPSVIDLSYNRYVRNYIKLYTTKRRELVEVLLGLTDYYFPIFEQIFDYYNIPLELKYCSIIESAMNPRAISRVGATGIWQFMYGTGRMYDMTINSYVDERRDPVKSTHAAARFMKDLYEIYGDWILVIAAYNCGPATVNKAIRRSGGKRNYWDIFYFLPRETRGHVPAFIAATYTMNYYEEHNLKPRNIRLPVLSDTIMINDELHLAQVSEVLDIPLGLLRDINPQYKRDIIPGHTHAFPLRIPLEYSAQFIDLKDSIYVYKDSVYFNPKNKVRDPASYTASRYVPEPPGPDMSKIFYTVKSGDNLGFIATWYNVRVYDLKYWNNIRGTMIRSGQKLAVYVHKSKISDYKKINAMSFEEKQRMLGKEVVTDTYADRVILEDKGDYVYYTVRAGDTLWDIAKKYEGVTDTDLMRLNNLEDATKIKPGQVIKIRKKG